tara:strand:- start:24 stop:293 length:270 start_codon:yes stop_codon:yes gene_type:complete
MGNDNSTQAEREADIIEDIGNADVAEDNDCPSYSLFIDEPLGSILDTIQQYGGMAESKQEVYFMEQMLEKDLDDCTSREIADASRALNN